MLLRDFGLFDQPEVFGRDGAGAFFRVFGGGFGGGWFGGFAVGGLFGGVLGHGEGGLVGGEREGMVVLGFVVETGERGVRV